MFIIYGLLLFYIYIVMAILFSCVENKTSKKYNNFNYDYIEQLDLAAIIILKDYIYKIIKLKKPLKIKKGEDKDEAQFINKLKKTIQMQILLIKTNKQHPNYVNRYLNKDKIKEMIIYIFRFYEEPLEKYILIEKHAKYLYHNKEKLKDYKTICNLSALYQNGVPPPPDISDYY